MAFSEGPDKGHAWVIAFTAGLITMILSGISKMVGILYVAVIDTYQVSREEATLPFTFRKSLRCLAGMTYFIFIFEGLDIKNHNSRKIN